MEISLDQHLNEQVCPGCGVTFTVVRGSAYGDGEPIGLYLVALHGHSPSGQLGHLAVAIIDQSSSEPKPIAVAMDVIWSPDRFGFSLVDWSQSPWKDELYFGRMLDRQSALGNIHRGLFLQIAEHVISDLPEVETYSQ